MNVQVFGSYAYLMFLYPSSNSSGSKSKKESIAGIYTSTNPSSLSSIGLATKPLNSLNSGLVELILKYSKISSPQRINLYSQDLGGICSIGSMIIS